MYYTLCIREGGDDFVIAFSDWDLEVVLGEMVDEYEEALVWVIVQTLSDDIRSINAELKRINKS